MRTSWPVALLLFVSAARCQAGETIDRPPVSDNAQVDLDGARKRYQETVAAVEKAYAKKKGEKYDAEKASLLGRAICEIVPLLCRARECTKDDKQRKDLYDEREKLQAELSGLREKGGVFNVWPLGMEFEPMPKDDTVRTVEKIMVKEGEYNEQAILDWVALERRSMKERCRLKGDDHQDRDKPAFLNADDKGRYAFFFEIETAAFFVTYFVSPADQEVRIDIDLLKEDKLETVWVNGHVVPPKTLKKAPFVEGLNTVIVKALNCKKQDFEFAMTVAGKDLQANANYKAMRQEQEKKKEERQKEKGG